MAKCVESSTPNFCTNMTGMVLPSAWMACRCVGASTSSSCRLQRPNFLRRDCGPYCGMRLDDGERCSHDAVATFSTVPHSG